MSQENVEIVRQCAEALNARDIARLKELSAPDIEIDLSRNIFNAKVHRGVDALEVVQSGIDDVWAGLEGDVTELIEIGDKVVTAITLKGTGKESGVDVTMQIFQIWEVKDSKLQRVVGGFRDRDEVLAAAQS